MRKISDICFKDVTVLADVDTLNALGFEADVAVNGKSRGRKFVELHGGRIWCESAEGRGSRFTFALPAGGPKQPKRGTTPLRM